MGCWWPLWKTGWRFPKKQKIELPYQPAIPLLGIYLGKKKSRTLIQKGTCTPMFIAVLFTIAMIQKQPECPWTDEWMKMWCISISISICTHTHTHAGILLSHKKNEMFPLGGHYAKSNKSEKDAYYMISLICGIWRIQQTSEYNSKKQTHRYREQMSGYHWAGVAI